MKNKLTIVFSLLPFIAFASGGDALPYLLIYIIVLLAILISPWFKLNIRGSLIVLLIGLLTLALGSYMTINIPFGTNQTEVLFKAIISPFIIFLASYMFVFWKFKNLRKS